MGAQRVEYNTPQPKWDEEVSLGSITEGLEGLDIGTGLDELVEVDEGDDELEYMPPPMKGEWGTSRMAAQKAVCIIRYRTLTYT